MKIFLAVLTLLLLGLPVVNAQNLATDTQERQRQLQAHYEKITSDNMLEAISATEIGLQSDDATLRSITLETALGSDNKRLQTMALQWVLSAGKSLMLRLDKPSGNDKGKAIA